MAIDSRFKLQTMEKGLPSIVISKNGIFLSVNLHKKLGMTSYVQLYLAEETREIAIMACDKNADEAVELKLANEYARIYNKDFVNNVAKLLKTSFDEVGHRVVGTPSEDGDYFIFDLKKAKKTNRGKNTDKED